MTSAALRTILLVEDDDGHARLVEKNLRRAGITNDIIRVCDGQQAMDFLWSCGHWQNQERPRHLLVLLDLNLPLVDGFTVMRELKSDPSTRSIPVVVIATTAEIQDWQRCNELGCEFIVTKPTNQAQFATAMRELAGLHGDPLGANG